ncbi:hypothetical protein A2U01_0080612, partial [Trifolium medium]|nr:hypothetical protein [Trifolium medium]
RQARNAKKKAAEAADTSSSVLSGPPSNRVSPTPSVEIIGDKRPRDEDLGVTHTTRKGRRLDDIEDPDNALDAGLHKLTPGVPAARFVLP